MNDSLDFGTHLGRHPEHPHEALSDWLGEKLKGMMAFAMKKMQQREFAPEEMLALIHVLINDPQRPTRLDHGPERGYPGARMMMANYRRAEQVFNTLMLRFPADAAQLEPFRPEPLEPQQVSSRKR